MLEKSTFSNLEIQTELCKRYGLIVNAIETINKGTANIYKIITDKGDFILKEFQSKYLQKDVQKEIKAIEYLKKNTNIPLPTYLKTNNNKFYFEHKGRIVVMQNFITGKVFGKNEGNYEQLVESAYYLGHIINGFEDYKVKDSISITDWYSKEEFNRLIKNMMKY